SQSSGCCGARRIHGLNVSTSKPVFDRLALLGLGLIGSSIARAARDCGAVGRVVASDASADVRRRVEALGIADEIAATNAEAATQSDLVIACVPVGQSGTVAADIASHLKTGA